MACLPTSDRPFQRQTDDDAGGPVPVDLNAGVVDEFRPLPDISPHAVSGASPNHGPFKGGQTVLLRGNGFKSNVRVWFGEDELDPELVVPVDPGRIQITTPPGHAGPVDITTQNGTDRSTRTTLSAAYVYDAFYLEPDSGPTSGGTEVTLHGDGTKWDEDTQVSIDLGPCDVTLVASETELTCTTPPGTAGSKSVRVTTSDDVSVDLLDGFLYGDSDTGFRGGLSGQPIDGNLEVVVLDNYTGSPVVGATVIVGTDPDDALVETVGSSGIVQLDGAALDSEPTVTIAAKCFSPITFVDVPVDTLTVYLDPVLDLSCVDLDQIPTLPGSSSGVLGASVRGELIWPNVQEFQRGGWGNVPPPKGDDERQVAYVLRTSTVPSAEFRLPSATSAVTPTSTGEQGYRFLVTAPPGNHSFYALAGIENRAVSPARFTAYAMGVVRGVVAQPGGTTDDVFIEINVPLDHTISLELEEPQLTPRGPDRALGTLTLRLGESGYAPLPVSPQQTLLPSSGGFEFVGVPPLVNGLLGSSYVLSARAVTGSDEGLPLSSGRLLSTTITSETVLVDEFVEIPLVTEPQTNTLWDGTHLSYDWAPGGPEVALTVFEIESRGGLVVWKVVAPGERREIDLPNLREMGNGLALKSGSITINVAAAVIDEFDYGSLRYRQLTTRGWDAYALDAFSANY